MEEVAFDHRLRRPTTLPRLYKVRSGCAHVMYKPRTGKAETSPAFIVCAATQQIP